MIASDDQQIEDLHGTLSAPSCGGDVTPSEWSLLLRAGTHAARSYGLEHEVRLKAFEQLWRTMDELAPEIMALCLWDLGWLRNAGETVTVEAVVGTCKAPPQYLSLLTQWLCILQREGFMDSNSTGEAHVGRALDEPALRSHISRKAASFEVPSDYPGFVEYFRACVTHQAALVSGAVSPHRLLFPMGSDRIVNGIYRHNPVAAMHNRTAAAIVRRACHSYPASRPIRILEVGAGTGATTSAILEELSDHSVQYRFTDVSRFFLKRASRQFMDAGIEFALLDIDANPSDQAFGVGSVDIIVGANALHTAKDVHRTLTYLRGLLADGGILVAIETTMNTALQMVTFGHFEGVNHFQDDRRHSNLPFLSETQWRAMLLEAGFARASAIPESSVARQGWSQHVIVATTDRA